MLGGQNIAEALVSKGYCTVVRYRFDSTVNLGVGIFSGFAFSPVCVNLVFTAPESGCGIHRFLTGP